MVAGTNISASDVQAHILSNVPGYGVSLRTEIVSYCSEGFFVLRYPGSITSRDFPPYYKVFGIGGVEDEGFIHI